MLAYLKGFYGYKNFGDELLLLGVLKRIFSNYSIEKLVIESGNKERLDQRLQENISIINLDLSKIETVSIQRHSSKKLTHLRNILGFSPYKKYFKFRGGGEVLNTERSFPHNGRNIPIMNRYSVGKGEFVLLGGIGKNNSQSIQKLYKKLLPKAQKIVLREKSSYETVVNFFQENNLKLSLDQIILYQDFSQEVLEIAQSQFTRKLDSNTQNKNISGFGEVQNKIFEKAEQIIAFLTKGKTHDTSGQFVDKYILINVNSHIFNVDTIQKIQKFCTKYPDSKKIFFPCDMEDDLKYFDELKNKIPDLELYDRTKYSLLTTLYFMSQAQAGIGARLHFLFPLKIFQIPLEPIVYKDKVRKLILEKF